MDTPPKPVFTIEKITVNAEVREIQLNKEQREWLDSLKPVVIPVTRLSPQDK